MPKMKDKNKIDDITGVETTGHEWDGIEELNNPLPRSWLWGLYATIVFAIIYSIAYPSWPGLTSSSKGLLGWSSRGDVAIELKALNESRASLGRELVATDLAKVADNPDLLQFALAGGESNYKVYCSQCHGSGAAGGDIYPNLLDDDWIWGGTVEDIYTTLRHGIRHEADDDTRLSQMPAFGDGLLERSEISDVAWYLRKISNQEHEAEAATRGKPLYAENCASCHGEQAEGIREFGAPRLADAIWLYGGSHEKIMAQIAAPKQGVMPAWADRLTDEKVRQLTLYVHNLGGGE